MPSKSIRQLAQEVGCDSTLLHSVLHTDLGLKPYKIKIKQVLSEEDKKQRLALVTQSKDKVNSDQQFTSRVWFSDEAHFYLPGDPKRRNSRLWADHIPPEAVLE